MFKKSLISILSAALLAVMSFTTAFASTPSEAEIGIAPYDSNILVDATENAWEYLYTVDRPLLLPRTVQVTNHFTNPDYITVQQFTSAGAATGAQLTLAPGTSGTIIVTPSLFGGSVDLRVLVDTSGVYRIGLSEGNLNEDLYSVELTDDSWVNLINMNILSVTDFEFNATNTPFSPGAINVRVVQDGEITSNIEDLEAGDSTSINVNGAATAQNVLLQVQASGTNFGAYQIGASVIQ